MRTTYGIALILLIVLAGACTQKVNDPADVQAIKESVTLFDKAMNSGDAEALVSTFATDATRLNSNQPVLEGRDAIRAALQKYFDQHTHEGRNVVKDTRVSGDLAVARGTYEGKSTLKAGGYSVRDQGKWIAVFQRERDGSWKGLWSAWNSDLPAADTLALGVEELALLQIEREWAEANVKNDAATLDRLLANEFQANWPSFVGNKKQLLSLLKSNTSKTESNVNSDMKAIVFGDSAIVNGLVTEKSSMAGKDTSGQYRYTDVFLKRDGRWQCVTSHSAKVK